MREPNSTDGVATVEMIQAVADKYKARPDIEPDTSGSQYRRVREQLREHCPFKQPALADVLARLKERGNAVVRSIDKGEFIIHELNHCPFFPADGSHGGAAIMEFPNGGWDYVNHRNSFRLIEEDPENFGRGWVALCRKLRVELVERGVPHFADDIANEFLRQECRDEGGVPTKFVWNGRLYEWNGEAYVECGGIQVLGEKLRAFMSQQCRRPVDKKGNVKDLPWSKADHAAKIVLDAIRVSTSTALPARAKMVKYEKTPVLRLEVIEPIGHLLPFPSGWGDINKLIAGEDHIVHAHDSSILCDRPIHTLGTDYDPNAECPNWLKFLSEIVLGDRGCCAVLQEWMGYHLLPDCRFEAFAVFKGLGQNGKGRFLRVLEALVGAGNYSSIALGDLDGRFNLSELRGKLANVSEDLDRRDLLDLGKLKSLVSGDKVFIDIKHRDPISERLTAKHTFASNHDLNLFDSSKAMDRRLIAIPFNYTVPDAKMDRLLFEKKLLPELLGILRWAVEGLRRLLEQGDFTRSEVIEAESQRMLEEANPSFDFFDQRIEVGSEHDFVSAEDLVLAWKTYAERFGLRERGYKSLKAQLQHWAQSRKVTTQEARLTAPDGSRPRGYRGIRMRPRTAVSWQHANRLIDEN